MPNDHPITISPDPGRLVVRWRGRTIVDTTHALELKEHVYPPVYYVPREDADMRNATLLGYDSWWIATNSAMGGTPLGRR